MTTQVPNPKHPEISAEIPEDIKLDEAGRNRVSRQSAADPLRPVRSLAADAAVTAAIGDAYGSD
jgi:hypothetical protein